MEKSQKIAAAKTLTSNEVGEFPHDGGAPKC